MTLGGRLQDMWRSMSVADDLTFFGGMGTPTVQMDGLTVAAPEAAHAGRCGGGSGLEAHSGVRLLTLLSMLSVLLAPLLALGLRLRGEPAARTAERLARVSLAKMEQAENTKATDAPEVLWFHGASVGEVRALLPLVSTTRTGLRPAKACW